jgi:hypothetical protein
MAGDGLASQERDTRFHDGLPVLIDHGTGHGTVSPRLQSHVAGALTVAKFERLLRPARAALSITAEQRSGRGPD